MSNDLVSAPKSSKDKPKSVSLNSDVIHGLDENEVRLIGSYNGGQTNVFTWSRKNDNRTHNLYVEDGFGHAENAKYAIEFHGCDGGGNFCGDVKGCVRVDLKQFVNGKRSDHTWFHIPHELLQAFLTQQHQDAKDNEEVEYEDQYEEEYE